MAIEPFKVRVIELALGAAAAHDFALAGGNALAAHGAPAALTLSHR